MSIEDLMIGDWYAISIHGVKYPMQVNKDTYSKLADTKIYPIKITHAILKKNRFEKTRAGIYLLSQYKKYRPNYYVSVENKKDFMDGEVFVSEETNDFPGSHSASICDCKYVHELQHALKMLKIDKCIIL